MDQERILQLRFEKVLELLIMYKKQNPKKDVYLSDKSTSEAIKWYQGLLDNIGMGDIIE